MQHTNDAAMIESCKTVQLINDIYALQLIVGRAHQVGHTVDDDQLDSLMLVEVHVERCSDDVQSLLTGLF